MKRTGFFGIDFYPTPNEVIERMMMAADVAGCVVLEPSAGSGAIVDWLVANGASEVLACEIDPMLRRTLEGRCRLVADDFLTLSRETVSHVELIVMNPPFSRAHEHISHAWEIAPAGCQIVALCNADSLKGKYTQGWQKLAETVKMNGSVQDFGQCFRTGAERDTDCRVACINLWKPGEGAEEWMGFFMSEDEEEEALGMQGPGLVPYNFVRDMVGRYVDAVSRFDHVAELSEEMNRLTDFTDGKERYGGMSIKFGAYKTGSSNYADGHITRETYRKELQKYAWRYIFDRFNMQKYVTNKVMEEMNRFVELQCAVPFTMRNVYRMLSAIVQTHGQRMEKVLEEAFDMVCSFSADNSTAGEKWKTNSNYMITRRFIVPYVGSYDPHWDIEYVKVAYGGASGKVTDLNKALCYLTGIPYEDSWGDLHKYFYKNKVAWGQWVEISPFFRIRIYKKGTAHFEFLDEKVWMEFNSRVATARGWALPEKVRTKAKRKRTA